MGQLALNRERLPSATGGLDFISFVREVMKKNIPKILSILSDNLRKVTQKSLEVKWVTFLWVELRG